MTGKFLLSIPPEVIIRIYQFSDDFLELLSFTSTCKHFQTIWLANKSAVFWPVAMRCIPAIDDIIIAVRATNLVKAAFCSGQQRPILFPIQRLSANARRPQLSEIQDVLDLQHLIKCIEYMFLDRKVEGDNGLFYSPDIGAPESPKELKIWRERFRRTMYRLFLAGALFFWPYNEPFFLAKENVPRTFLHGYLKEYSSLRDKLTGEEASLTIDDPFSFTRQEIEYFTQFTVYDLNADQKREDEVFGSFVEWLIEQGKDRSVDGCSRSMEDLDHQQIDEIREIMALIAAYEHLITKFTNGDGKYAHHRLSPDEFNTPPEVPKRHRTVSVIMFGVFRVEEITMPATVSDSRHTLLIANPVLPTVLPSQTSGTEVSIRRTINVPMTSAQVLDIPHILDSLYLGSGRSNHHDGYPAPHPPLQLFTYTLRKHFNLRFERDAFDNAYIEHPYNEFIESAAVFRNASNRGATSGLGMLRYYQPPVLSYRRMD